VRAEKVLSRKGVPSRDHVFPGDHERSQNDLCSGHYVECSEGLRSRHHKRSEDDVCSPDVLPSSYLPARDHMRSDDDLRTQDDLRTGNDMWASSSLVYVPSRTSRVNDLRAGDDQRTEGVLCTDNNRGPEGHGCPER
jgi:hypothetical protein